MGRQYDLRCSSNNWWGPPRQQNRLPSTAHTAEFHSLPTSRQNGQGNKSPGTASPPTKLVPTSPWHEWQKQSVPHPHTEMTWTCWMCMQGWMMTAQRTNHLASGSGQSLTESRLLARQLLETWEQNWKSLLWKLSQVLSTKENVYLSEVCQLAFGNPPFCVPEWPLVVDQIETSM